MRQMRFVSWGVRTPCSVSTLDFVWFIPQGTAGDGEGLLSLWKSQNSLTAGQGLNPPVEPGKKVPCPGLLCPASGRNEVVWAPGADDGGEGLCPHLG